MGRNTAGIQRWLKHTSPQKNLQSYNNYNGTINLNIKQLFKIKRKTNRFLNNFLIEI